MQSYLVTVHEKQPLSKNMVRISLRGESLKQFPATSPGSYIKLMFNQDGSPVVQFPYIGPRPRMRTYTVKEIDPKNGEITLDFVRHNHTDNPQKNEGQQNSPAAGLASHWAEQAKPGDKISFAGPGSSNPLASSYDWVLFAGDLTALPSIENYLNQLPGNTKGRVFIQASASEDIRHLNKPQEMEIIWLTQSESTATAIARQPLPQGIPAVWAACEFSEMRALRRLFNQDMNIPREQIYLSSYWKEGRSEEQHKKDKRQEHKREETAQEDQARLQLIA